jgi:hypothetical protein
VIVLRDVDREMTSLSNDITASHARLREITAMVLQQAGGGAQLIIDHQNEMGSTFRLMRASYALDGATIATRTDDNGSLAEQTGFSVYNGRVASGEHTLTVSLEYQGNGYGIFSYIRGYTFRARSVQTFTVPDARALRLVVVGYERGGATVAIEDPRGEIVGYGLFSSQSKIRVRAFSRSAKPPAPDHWRRRVDRALAARRAAGG